MNRVKRRPLRAGYSVVDYGSYNLDAIESYKNSYKYKKWKKEHEDKRKSIIDRMRKRGKIDYKKAFQEAYSDYIPSSY